MNSETPGRAAANFNRLARIYRALEFVAFGRDLERVRFAHVDALRDCESILLLGDGDGRFLARLLATSRAHLIHSIDASAAMLARAASRVGGPDRNRVVFTCADALTYDFAALPPGARAGADSRPPAYDGIVTLFFLDCFNTRDVEQLIGRIVPHATTGATWLFGDFVVPARGWQRWRARVWLTFLYAFFGLETGLGIRTLPDSEGALTRAGLQPQSSATFQHGLLRATRYRRG